MSKVALLADSKLELGSASGKTLRALSDFGPYFVKCNASLTVQSIDERSGVTLEFDGNLLKEVDCGRFFSLAGFAPNRTARAGDMLTLPGVDVTGSTIQNISEAQWDDNVGGYVLSWTSVELSVSDNNLRIEQADGLCDLNLDSFTLPGADESVSVGIKDISTGNAPACQGVTTSDTVELLVRSVCQRDKPLSFVRVTIPSSGFRGDVSAFCGLFGVSILYEVEGTNTNLFQSMPSPQFHSVQELQFVPGGNINKNNSSVATHLRDNIFKAGTDPPDSLASLWPLSEKTVALTSVFWSAENLDNALTELDANSTAAITLKSFVLSTLRGEDDAFPDSAIVQSASGMTEKVLVGASLGFGGLHPIILPPDVKESVEKEVKMSTGIDDSVENEKEVPSEDSLLGADEGGGIVYGEALIELEGVPELTQGVNATVASVIGRVLPQKADGAEFLSPWDPLLASVVVGIESPSVGYLVRLKAAPVSSGTRVDAHALVEAAFRALDGLSEGDGEPLVQLFSDYGAPPELEGFSGLKVWQAGVKYESVGDVSASGSAAAMQSHVVEEHAESRFGLSVKSASVESTNAAKQEIRAALARPLMVKQSEVSVALEQSGESSEIEVNVSVPVQHSLQKRFIEGIVGFEGESNVVLSSRLQNKMASSQGEGFTSADEVVIRSASQVQVDDSDDSSGSSAEPPAASSDSSSFQPAALPAVLVTTIVLI